MAPPACPALASSLQCRRIRIKSCRLQDFESMTSAAVPFKCLPLATGHHAFVKHSMLATKRFKARRPKRCIEQSMRSYNKYVCELLSKVQVGQSRLRATTLIYRTCVCVCV